MVLDTFSTRPFRFSHAAGVAALAGLAVLTTGARAQSLATGAEDAEVARLRALTIARPLDNDVSFAHVRAAIAARDYEAAIVTLERLLFYNPGLSLAKYELGNLYARLSANAMAVRYYEEALADPGLDAETRKRIEAYLPAARKELLPDRVYGLLQTGLRFNSNPADAPSQSLIVPTPGATIYGSDTAAYVFGDLRYVHDFQNARGDTFEARAQAYATGQFHYSDLNVGVIDLTAGPRFGLSPETMPGLSIHPYAAFGASTLAGSLYGTTAGGGVSAHIPLSKWFSIEPGVEWRATDVRLANAATSDAVVNSGSLGAVSLAARWLAAERLTFDARVFATRNWATNAVLSATGLGVEASLKIDIDPPSPMIPLAWSVTPFARYADYAFDNINPALLAGAARHDTQWRVGARADMPITSTFGLTALTQFMQNNSNVPQFQSSAWSLALGATVRF